MSILWDKDWRYKIALDKNKQNEVIKFANKLTNKSATFAIKQEVNFFSRYFSIEQVITCVQTAISDIDYVQFSHNIKNNLHNLLHIPKELKIYYQNKIATLKPCYHELLNFILDYGLKSKVIPPMQKYYKIVLGKFYKKTFAKIKKYASGYKKSIDTNVLEEFEVRNSLNELKKKISSSSSVLNLWGDNNDIAYNLKFNNSFGYGKFRSKVTSDLENVLTINCPNNKISENALHMQYLSNVYPGYANFILSQFNNDKRNIDFGASFVINGWSTFSAWHIFPSIYTKNLKIENAKIIMEISKCAINKNYSHLYLMLQNLYNKDEALKMLLQITQKPGKFESRIIGAIATEIVIDENYALNPKNYLERLKNVDITNYFTTLNKLK